MSFISFDKRALLLSNTLTSKQILDNIKSLQTNTNNNLEVLQNTVGHISRVILSAVNSLVLFGLFAVFNIFLTEAASIILTLSLNFYLLTLPIDGMITSVSQFITRKLHSRILEEIVDNKNSVTLLTDRLDSVS